MAAGITAKDSMFYVRLEKLRAAVERMKEKQKTLQLLDKKDREALSQVEEGPECREL